jgi:hypothetical protein
VVLWWWGGERWDDFEVVVVENFENLEKEGLRPQNRIVRLARLDADAGWREWRPRMRCALRVKL